jgi:NadR type nicotinamide-nucleotide adenylyltransferase
LSIRKIVVIGPESTGKSSLSEALANSLHTVWVQEYARQYLKKLDRPYEERDLAEIAKGQIDAEEKLCGRANKFLICDTDLNVIKVWSEHSYNRCCLSILEGIAERRYDLYLLTYIDVAWQDDPQREHPEEGMRSYFYKQYLDIVINSGVRWADMRGTEEQRLKLALEAIEALQTDEVDY